MTALNGGLFIGTIRVISDEPIYKAEDPMSKTQ
ncbi:hypothetical protein EV207_13635 [Scopulibacillus darangshiensis]|uniref:Uncharacterized protein n=1 Tax=Scopulibacillus darangshiensis TaxID=442528 RepID=A0A4R2NM38_9BACL|nr:hypothetical protein EV207_13635 [Scopulibacillus darangshiensis]